jgi:hypothetical protein
MKPIVENSLENKNLLYYEKSSSSFAFVSGAMANDSEKLAEESFKLIERKPIRSFICLVFLVAQTYIRQVIRQFLSPPASDILISKTWS